MSEDIVNAIIDASSLIVLAHLDALWLLQKVYKLVGLPTSVFTEAVLQGKAKGYVDANRIEAAIVDGWLVQFEPTPAEETLAEQLGRQATALSSTDCDALGCAEMRDVLLIVEDRRIRNAAKARGIDYTVIQVIPLQGLIQRKLGHKECDRLLADIGRAMHTDAAFLHVLRMAAREIEAGRKEGDSGER
jgi:predicted nucleic acid-binding protein